MKPPREQPAPSGGGREGRVIYLHPNPTAHLVGDGGFPTVTSHAAGRHRAPGRFNPVAELTGIVAKSAQPAVKTSAIIAASGGLVASFALPASAATAVRRGSTPTTTMCMSPSPRGYTGPAGGHTSVGRTWPRSPIKSRRSDRLRPRWTIHEQANPKAAPTLGVTPRPKPIYHLSSGNDRLTLSPTLTLL